MAGDGEWWYLDVAILIMAAACGCFGYVGRVEAEEEKGDG